MASRRARARARSSGRITKQHAQHAAAAAPASGSPAETGGAVARPQSPAAFLGAAAGVDIVAPPAYRPTDELGAFGTKIFGGILYDEYLPQLQGWNKWPIYEQMRRSDGQIRALLNALKLPIRAARWSVEPHDPDDEDSVAQAEFVEHAVMHHMDQTWADALRDALLCLDYGFMIQETVYDHRDLPDAPGALALKYLAFRDPRTIYRFNTDPATGRLVAVTQLPPPDYVYRVIPAPKIVLYAPEQEGANFEGMALALDTPVPTPHGWRTMADLTVGDPVFDETGKIRYVTATRAWEDRPAYALTFDSGETIVADAAHLWSVLAGAGRRPQVVTTETMATAPLREGTTARWAITTAQPLDYPAQCLPIDPYVLGWWLSDGTALTAEITSKDAETRTLLEACGYALTEKAVPREKAATYRVQGLQRTLHLLGLVGNKHIPPAYRRGAIDQRLALVQGLMDGDGTVDRWGRCEFCNCDPGIVAGMVEILASLGVKARVQTVPPAGNRRQTIYRVHFVTALPAFRLTRKLDRQRDHTPRAGRHYLWRIERVANQATKCIEVDAPSHLYLVGRSCIPTHNSVLRPAYKHWFIKDRLYALQAVALARSGTGIPYVKLPAGVSKDDEAKALSIVTTLASSEQAGVTLPSGFDLNVFTFGQIANFQEAINHHDLLIVRSCLAQFLNLGSADVGSYALGQTHAQALLDSLNALADHLADRLNHGPIRELVRLNFQASKVKGWPRLKHGDIGERDLTTLSTALSSLVTAGVIRADDPLEDRVRVLMDLPEPDPDSARQAPSPMGMGGGPPGGPPFGADQGDQGAPGGGALIVGPDGSISRSDGPPGAGAPPSGGPASGQPANVVGPGDQPAVTAGEAARLLALADLQDGLADQLAELGYAVA